MVKEVVDESAIGDFARNPPCCRDDALAKKLFAEVRGITQFGDPDLALSEIAKSPPALPTLLVQQKGLGIPRYASAYSPWPI